MTIDSSGHVNLSNTLKLKASLDNPILFENQHSVTTDGSISTFDDSSGTMVVVGSNFYINSSGSETRFNTSEESSAIIVNRNGEINLLTGGTGATASTKVNIDSSGNVGIGTTSPSSALHVDSSNDGPIFDSGGTGNTNHALLVRDSGNNQLLRVNNNGKVGIGTTSPSTELHLSTSTQGDIVTFESTDAGANTGPNLLLYRNSSSPADDDNIGAIRFRGRNDNSQDVDYAEIESFIDDASDGTEDGVLAFRTIGSGTSAERMRIDSSGRVGIGVTPTAQFAHNLIQVGHQATLGANAALSTTGQTFLTHNLYYNTDGNLRVFNTSSANEGAIIQIREGTFTFSNSAATTGTPTVVSRAQILSNGALQVKVGGSSFDDWASNQGQCQINTDATSEVSFTVNAQTTSFGLDVQRLLCDRGNNSAYDFLTCTSGNLGDDEFHLRGDGNALADGSFTGGGADYAEYFEWKDGNTSNEDRVGISVKLDGNMIVASSDSDNASDIIGVISGNPAVVGDSAYMKWNEKYLRDDYGRYKRDENGDRIQNSNYDESKTYVPREDRPEWDTVGLMGKLRIKKGQKTGTNWIKMRDVSDTVEEWLVR
jgi:uncharacterized protein YaiE (UPF0345 family)